LGFTGAPPINLVVDRARRWIAMWVQFTTYLAG